MSKPIKLTDELIKKIQAEFTENLKSMKLFDGKVSYNKSFKWEDGKAEKAIITFTPTAFAKMTMLLLQFDSEVAWHGVVYRDEKIPNLFKITDILVYPQLVSGSTVNTDQNEYTAWLYGFDDEVFSNIRMQGHSHVNFGTTPSAVDTTHQEQILNQLDDDMFYIFMIWNKKFERTTKLYDLRNNTLYENDDIDIFIGEDCVNLDHFIADAKRTVKPKPVTSYNNSYGGNYGGKYSGAGAAAAGVNNTTQKTTTPATTQKTTTPAVTQPANRPRVTTTPVTPAANAAFDDDDDDFAGYPYASYLGHFGR